MRRFFEGRLSRLLESSGTLADPAGRAVGRPGPAAQLSDQSTVAHLLHLDRRRAVRDRDLSLGGM